MNIYDLLCDMYGYGFINLANFFVDMYSLTIIY